MQEDAGPSQVNAKYLGVWLYSYDAFQTLIVTSKIKYPTHSILLLLHQLVSFVRPGSPKLLSNVASNVTQCASQGGPSRISRRIAFLQCRHLGRTVIERCMRLFCTMEFDPVVSNDFLLGRTLCQLRLVLSRSCLRDLFDSSFGRKIRVELFVKKRSARGVINMVCRGTWKKLRFARGFRLILCGSGRIRIDRRNIWRR